MEEAQLTSSMQPSSSSSAAAAAITFSSSKLAGRRRLTSGRRVRAHKSHDNDADRMRLDRENVTSNSGLIREKFSKRTLISIDELAEPTELSLRLQAPSARQSSCAEAQNNRATRTKQMAKISSDFISSISISSKFTASSSTMKQRMRKLAGQMALVVLTLLIAAHCQIGLQTADGAKLPDIYWNSSNPIFRSKDSHSNLFDVNKKQHDNDQVDLVCPQALPQQQQVSANDSNAAISSDLLQERYIIYSVSKDEYDNCRLNGPSGQVVAKCDQPQAARPPRPSTITFRSFTPQPNGLEFKPGQDYYFITALQGHLQEPQKRFSPCREQNMRVIFRVCCKAAGSSSASASSSGSSLGSGAAPSSSVATSNNLPTSAPQVGQPAKAQPTRRPSSVTIRPTFGSIGAHFTHTLANQQQQQQQQQLQQQPVTVLPIEVIQNDNSQAQSQTQPEPEPAPSNSVPDMILNDLPPESSTPRALRQSHPLLPFDPSVKPEQIVQTGPMDRWQPTPLPPRIRFSQPPPQVNPMSGPAFTSTWQQPDRHNSNQQQPSSGLFEPPPPSLTRSSAHDFGRLRPPPPQQQQQHQQSAPSRGSLYPFWQQQSNNVPAPDQLGFTVAPPHEPSPSSTGAPTYAVALLVPLLGLAILLALGLERRLR